MACDSSWKERKLAWPKNRRVLALRARRSALLGEPQCAGVTLLELILALSLSVIVMGAIGMAINLHMKTLQTRRTQVEESQLARQILSKIANDLRSAVQFQVIDFTGAEKLLDPNAIIDPTISGMTDDANIGSDLLAGLTATEEAEEPASIASTAAPPATPGLRGNQYELQIDVSHLPRVEDYQVMINPLSGETVADIPSDVKTVAYYLQPDMAAAQTTGVLSDVTQQDRLRATGTVGRGLVRRELDRAVSLWASQNNNLDDLAAQGQMLAPEVTGLEFRYFDGTEWLTEWDSEVRQGLPVAVAIAVEIGGDASSSADEGPRPLLQPLTSDPATGGAPALGELNPDRLLFRLVVHLPASEPTSADTARFPATTETEETTEGATTPTTGDNTDAGGTNGGTGGGTGGQGTGGGPGGQGPGGGGPGGAGGQGRGPGGGGTGGGGGPGGGGNQGPGGGRGGRGSSIGGAPGGGRGGGGQAPGGSGRGGGQAPGGRGGGGGGMGRGGGTGGGRGGGR